VYSKEEEEVRCVPWRCDEVFRARRIVGGKRIMETSERWEGPMIGLGRLRGSVMFVTLWTLR
jgi:hypothetical protein